MTSLPASVRVALWATAGLAGEIPMQQVAERALPDVDHVAGDLDRLTVWHDFGESAVLVALPRPGDLSGMPHGPLALSGAATEAGECVFVPGIGGALVPTVEDYGPEGDVGTQVIWTAYDCDPTPIHRLEAVALADVELRLRESLIHLTTRLEDIDASPLGGRVLREAAVEGVRAGDWATPEGLPSRALRIIALAARISWVAELGLDPELHSFDGHSTEERRRALRQVRAAADSALAEATNVACLNLAGLRQDRTDS